MNAAKLNFLLTIACLIAASLGCRNANFQPRPEDGVIKLNAPGESPKAKDGSYQRGDQVAVIDNDGKLSVTEVIDGVSGELVLVPEFVEGEEKNWLPAEPSYLTPYGKEKVEKTATGGYKFKYGDRRPFYKWFPPEQVFAAPWANNVNLKIGDVVYKKTSDFLDGEKGVVSEVPIKRFGKFRVRFGASETSTEVSASEIYSFIEPAKSENLSPGGFVYYDKKGWAMVIGKRGDKIIIRLSGDKPEDIMVDVSKLQILK